MNTIVRNFIKSYENARDKSHFLEDSHPFADFLLIWGSTIVSFLFLINLLSSIVFLLHGKLSNFSLIIACVFSCIFCWYSTRAFFKRNHFLLTILIVELCVFIFLAAMMIAGHFYDLSYDGQTYHQEAIIRLKEGWNPIYNEYISKPEIHYYPKGTWINEGIVYLATNHIEYAKAINFIVIIASLILSYAVLLWLKVNKFLGCIASILLALNPVSTYQMFSFYLDGQLISFYVSLLAISILIFVRNKNYLLIPFTFLIALAINVKSSAIIYMSFLLVGLLIQLYIHYKNRLLAKVFMTVLISYSIGVCIIGFNPFITNTITKGNPLYRIIGKDAYDFRPGNMPANFLDKNSLTVFFLSIFSESNNLKGPDTLANLKVPFTVSKSDIDVFHFVDPNEGGFGPLYGGAFIISLLILMSNFPRVFLRRLKNSFRSERIVLDRKKFHPPYITIMVLFTLATIFVSVIITPLASYARYVPQAGIIPTIIVIFAFTTQSLTKKIFGILLTYALFLNIGIILYSNLTYNISHSTLEHDQLMQLTRITADKPILVNFGEFTSTRIRLQEAGVHFVVVKSLPCKNAERILSDNITMACIPEAKKL